MSKERLIADNSGKEGENRVGKHSAQHMLGGLSVSDWRQTAQRLKAERAAEALPGVQAGKTLGNLRAAQKYWKENALTANARHPENTQLTRSGDLLISGNRITIDVDGSPLAPKIDYEFKRNSHGKYHKVIIGQAQTSFRHPSGRYFDGLRDEFVVLNTSVFHKYGIKAGADAFVKYNGQIVPAFVGDLGGRGHDICEMSAALAERLHIPSDPRHGGVEKTNVQFLVTQSSIYADASRDKKNLAQLKKIVYTGV
jgi:Fungal chitosanase of glycosyl hydrolase group 75